MSHNLIPGAAALGNGISVFGSYSLENLTSQLFVSDGDTYPWTIDDHTFDVPSNVALLSTSGGGGRTQVFESQEAFQQHFAAKASLSVGGLTELGAFTGQFGGAYSSAIRAGKDNYWCLSEQNWTAYRLMIKDLSQSRLNPTFVADMNALPTRFDADTQGRFFDFFEKYGTHFVDQVEVGGQLYYYSAVRKSFSSSLEEVQAQASLEYKAVFVDTKAEAEATWEQLGESWTRYRTVSIEAVGGTPAILDGLSPSYGDSYNNLFEDWKEGIESHPAAVQIVVKPIYYLASLDEETSDALYDAMRDALAAYMTTINVETSVSRYEEDTFENWAVYLGSRYVAPSETSSDELPGGYQLVVVDRASREVFLNRTYYFADGAETGMEGPGDYPTDGSEVYEPMEADMISVDENGPEDYIVGLAGFGVPAYLYPPSAVAQWLLKNGIDTSPWLSTIEGTGAGVSFSVAGIGRKNRRNGVCRLINWYYIGPGHGAHYSATQSPVLPFYKLP